jgi:hypothetical protein
MVPEAFVQNKVIIIMDVAMYLFVQTRWQLFQESYSLEFVSLGITLWRLLVKGAVYHNKNKYPGG